MRRTQGWQVALQRRARVGLLTGLLALACAPSHAQVAGAAPLKAAILVNMLMFVDWPQGGAQAGDRLTMCYTEDSVLSGAMDELAGRLLKNRLLMVSKVAVNDVARCHALYVSGSQASQLARLRAGPLGSGVLLMGDTAGFFQQGVAVNLALDAGRIVFDVDLQAARQAGLTVSSKLLRLARHVQE